MFSKEKWDNKSTDEKADFIYYVFVVGAFLVFWPIAIVAILAKNSFIKYIKDYVEKNRLNFGEQTNQVNKQNDIPSIVPPVKVPKDSIYDYRPEGILKSSGQNFSRNLLAVFGFLFLLLAVFLYFLLK